VIYNAGDMNACLACHGLIIPIASNLSTWKPDPRSVCVAFRTCLTTGLAFSISTKENITICPSYIIS
jgi:hypothetical protein